MASSASAPSRTPPTTPAGRRCSPGRARSGRARARGRRRRRSPRRQSAPSPGPRRRRPHRDPREKREPPGGAESSTLPAAREASSRVDRTVCRSSSEPVAIVLPLSLPGADRPVRAACRWRNGSREPRSAQAQGRHGREACPGRHRLEARRKASGNRRDTPCHRLGRITPAFSPCSSASRRSRQRARSRSFRMSRSATFGTGTRNLRRAVFTSASTLPLSFPLPGRPKRSRNR